VTYDALCDVCESQGVATKEMLMAEPNYQTNEQATSLMLGSNQPNLRVL